jgi:protein O-GlcNAc transferase
MASWRDVRVHFHYRVASLFLRLGRDEWAAGAYERALRLRPDDRQAEFHRAWCLLHVPRRRPEGITAFQHLLRVQPSASGFFLLGCGLQHELRHEEAVQAFREAARLEKPTLADFNYNCGVSLIALRQFDEAAEAYGHVTQLSPSDGEAWGALGAAFAALGRWTDAVPCQERAMRLAPSADHGVNLAMTLYELHRLEEAERALRDALVIDPQSIDAQALLAQVLAGQERYDEAITQAREICESNPDAPSSRAVLAGVLTEAGHLDEALTEAKAAVEAAPTDARCHSVLGGLYLKMNDGAAALALRGTSSDRL